MKIKLPNEVIIHYVNDYSVLSVDGINTKKIHEECIKNQGNLMTEENNP